MGAMFMAEHHLRPDRVVKAKGGSRAMGRGPFVQAAIDSPGGGTHGGVAAFCQKSLCCQRFLSGVSEVVNVGSGTCWLFLEFKLRGLSVAMGVLYLVRSIGATGVPWVSHGDFNVCPEMPAESGFLEPTKSGVECARDVGRAVIDYVVCFE
eukprot:2161362-Pyramimonas_sp.AAC.1